MFQDHEKAKNIAATIQAIVVSIAVVVGGGWTAWEFYQLDRIEKAKADLKIQQNAADQMAVLNIRLEIKDKKSEDLSYLQVKAILTNAGKKDAYLDYSKHVLSVTRVALGEGGKINYENQVKSRIYMPTDDLKIGHIPNAVIRGGESKEYPFIIPVSKPGIFLIRFIVKVSNQDQRTPIENEKYDGEWSHQIIHVSEEI